MLTAIRYYATGSFQLLDADTVHLSQPNISRIVTRVTDALVRKARSIIKFPFDEAGQDNIKEGFYTPQHRIPNVLGCVDGSLVPIKSPSQHEESYICRRGHHTLDAFIWRIVN
jgi:hypothetical protein